MYYQYFGLTEAPFSIAVDPRYLFMSPRHRDALAHLLYGVGSGDGFILLTGEVGTGKTTINRCLLEQLPQDTDMAIVMNPALNAIELLATVCDELHIDYDSQNYSLKTLTDKLHAFLLENHARGRKTVLLIDEAQHLDFDVLEQIRLLTNLETNSEKLLQIILIGQPELGQMLARPELRQLNQRITARYNLEPLTIEETGAYIHHRLQVAGMSADRVIFPASVVRDIHRATLGIPRVINKLCDRVLLGAYGRNKSRADKSMLQLAIREVLGEDAVPAVASRWLLPVVAVVLALAVGAWWWQSNSGWSWPLSADSVRPLAQPVQEPLQAAPEAAERLPAPSAPERYLVTEVSEPPAPVTGAAAALLPAGRALELLWQVQTGEAAPDDTCPATLQGGLVCEASAANTWDELMTFDRPLALAMVTPERFSADVLLLGMDGTNAWVYTLEGVVMLPLAELAPGWTGRYSYLWQPPAGYTRPLALGDTGPVVAEVARLFARLDSRDRPLADTVFNTGLEHRVRMFQVEHDLEDDGVVGVLTLLRLNELLDIDPSARAARQQLDQNSEGDPR